MHLKHVIAFCLGVILVVGGAVMSKLNTPTESRIVDTARKVSSLPMNATYIIEDVQYQLFEGESKEEYRAGAVTADVVTLHQVPAYGDIDGDGDDDALVILEHESGERGLSYYAAVAWYDKGKYTGTDSVLLGDRVEIESYEIEEGVGRVVFRASHDDPLAEGARDEQVIEVALNHRTGRIQVLEN